MGMGIRLQLALAKEGKDCGLAFCPSGTLRVFDFGHASAGFAPGASLIQPLAILGALARQWRSVIDMSYVRPCKSALLMVRGPAVTFEQPEPPGYRR